jgi:hypothetical protein
MHDYRLDERETPERHSAATRRLIESTRHPISNRPGDCPGVRLMKALARGGAKRERTALPLSCLLRSALG